MPRVLFTTETAHEMAARSIASRRSRALARAQERLTSPNAAASPESPNDDPFATSLSDAQEELLSELRSAPDAKSKASLAQALRNLRETYHLVTGEARPGVRRDGRRRGPSTAAAWREATAPAPAPASEPPKPIV